MLTDHTWVNLHSDKGMGKTAFLTQFRNEMLVRNLYPDGVYFFDLKALYKSHINLSSANLSSQSSSGTYANNLSFQRQSSKATKKSGSKNSKNSKNSYTALGYSLHNEKKPVNFKDLIKGTFSKQFDHNMKEFFKDKKMLIIFDGFDLIV
jgi:hypothetical protein